MYDIITFGSATLDIFVKAKGLKNINNEAFLTGKGICMDLGSKLDIEEMLFFSGGGGTNTAATFANQGLRVAYCGAVGDDLAGQEIIGELKERKIDTRFVVRSKTKTTNHSIVLAGKERTILVYRGASEDLEKKDIPWNKLKTIWLYIAPLSGSLCNRFGEIINFAKEKGIKIALNPGSCQLSLPDFAQYANKVDILILNKEEASFLTKTPYNQEQEIFKKIDEMCSGIVIMTKGGEGVSVSDGKHLFSAKPFEDRKIVDTTGAGDSFASGFVSSYIRNPEDIEGAIQLGLGNSAACLSMVGAKPGLLKKGEEFVKVEVTKSEI